MSARRRHQGNRDEPEPSKCIGILGLSLYTTERELEAEFGKFGPLEEVQVVLDGHSGRSRGFAFVYFESVEDSKAARDAMTGAELDGRKIRGDYSITKRAHTPTPGMYLGRPTYGSRYVKLVESELVLFHHPLGMLKHQGEDTPGREMITPGGGAQVHTG